ncbi:TonB family protein [Rhodopseudomonas sp. RCAM05734]|uniref:TonB family protein n=1 Tax=Rhodopseudomonas sp. RCAM05734 TaxID=3457549 RepID=UPI0040444B23
MSLSLVALTVPALAGDLQTSRFDLPSQSLSSALESFCNNTGMFAAYDGKLVDGRVSSPVTGEMTPKAALGRLLEGTGLTVEYTSSNAFVVMTPPRTGQVRRDPAEIGRAALSSLDESERRYSALLQRSVETALCADSRTKLGDYRAAVRFRIDPGGALTGVRLLGSTGNPDRDAAIVAVAAQVSLKAPPPARMQQPFAMVVLPYSPGGSPSCPWRDGGRG